MHFKFVFVTSAAIFAADALQMETTANSTQKHKKIEKMALENIVNVAAGLGLGAAVTMEYFGRTGATVSDSSPSGEKDPNKFFLPEEFANNNGATVREYHIENKGDGVKDITFELPFIQNGEEKARYSRSFQIKVATNANRLVIQNHAYYVFGFDDQNSYTRLNQNAENLQAVVVTTLGSDDLVSSNWDGLPSLPGWNAWGCGVQVDPTPVNSAIQCTSGNSPDATCLRDRDAYPCYQTQRDINPTNACATRNPFNIADSSASCACMSAQDDVQYLRQVILFLKSYENFQWLEFPVTSLGMSQGGIFTGDVYHSLTTFQYQNVDYEYIDGAVVVSAASLRNYLPQGQDRSNRPVLTLMGYQDTLVPPCISKGFVEFLGFDTTTYPYRDGANDRAESACNDNFGDGVCISSDNYLYSSLAATLASFAGRSSTLILESDVTWGGIIPAADWGLNPNDDVTGSLLNCGHVTTKPNVQVCIYNYGHDFPFYTGSRQFTQGELGVQAWIKLLNDFLDSVSI